MQANGPRIHFEIANGIVLVGSDAHIWPGPITTATRAFIKFSKDLQPKLAVLNGDVVDLPQISRHDPIGWESHPKIADEIAAAQVVLTKIEDAVPRNCKLAWTLGNHDARFEKRLAHVAKEYASVNGVHLKDHFSKRYQPCYSAWVNNDTVIKHRYSGGSGAARNNVLKSGKNVITGHLHAQQVTAVSNYCGTLYGVDTGCLAEPSHPAFIYTEDNPLDWRSGFAVLKFHKGKLLPPELVTTWDKNSVVFRGDIIKV